MAVDLGFKLLYLLVLLLNLVLEGFVLVLELAHLLF